MFRQAITTKHLGPTNHRGSRIKATAAAGSITVNCFPGVSDEKNHIAAAKDLATKFEWSGKWFGGEMSDGRRCFVWAGNNEDPDFVVDEK